MKRAIRIGSVSILALFLFVMVAGSLFVFIVGEGFDSFETTPPELPPNLGDEAILIFSKTNGFRHKAAIEASLPIYRSMASENGWQIFETENGAIFNSDHLDLFKVVVWNNTTGRVLLEDQRAALKSYLINGGGFVGIHGAGDHSHKWDWYETRSSELAFPITILVSLSTLPLSPLRRTKLTH